MTFCGGWVLACLAAVVAAKQAPAMRPVDHRELLAVIRQSPARVLVVNVWVTWCPPCKREFPHFVGLRRDFARRGVEVLFVSVDYEEDRPKAARFLAAEGVTWPSYVRRGVPNDFIRGMHAKWSGALPATFVYAHGGKLLEWWEGAVEAGALRDRVLRHLPQKKGKKK
jgi:thiol-disulfide isomerase/thioredoxin